MATPEHPSARLASRHRGTLNDLYRDPPLASIRYAAVVAMFEALGATVDERRRGSRVAIEFKGRTLHFDKPHPRTELGKGKVRHIREFLELVGVTP